MLCSQSRADLIYQNGDWSPAKTPVSIFRLNKGTLVEDVPIILDFEL